MSAATRACTLRSMHTLPFASFTGPALRAAAHVRLRRWDALARDPELAQRATLRWLCSRAADTAFGVAHRLGDCASWEEFRDAVPVREYGDFLPWLQRMRTGERDVLWPGFVPFFAMSGGTTLGPGGLKYLPVSRDQLRWQTKAAFDVVARYVELTGDRALTGGYSLGLVPPVVLHREGAVEVSSNPALLLHHAPQLSRAFSLPRPPVSAVVDFEERLTAIAEAYVEHDVRMVAATPCWLPVFFEKLIDAANARGRRASTVREIWPGLRGLITGGANPGPYRLLIADRVGAELPIVDHYNSTEAGLVACADRLDGDELLMVPDRGTFYEFVERGSGGRRVPLWEVETDRDYAVIISTPSGLLGYALGDVVRFTSVSPHRVKIVGRVSGGLSPVHEVTSESMIEAAVLAACAQTGAATIELTSAADEPSGAGGKSRYRFFVEFARAPASIAEFTRTLDDELKKQNVLYGVYRVNDVLLLPPEVVSLPPGASARFMNALGPRSVQQKFPRTLDRARRAVLERTLAS